MSVGSSRRLKREAYRECPGRLVGGRAVERRVAVSAAEEALAAYTPTAPACTLATHRFSLGDVLRDAGRHRDAEPHYQAILDDPGSSPYDRNVGLQGLAWCALAAGDSNAAGRHAAAAVGMAEALGDDNLCTALGVLVAVHRAAGDLDAAWRAASRHLEAAGRVGGHYRPYFAARDAVDVALDRGDLVSAGRLIAVLDVHAAAMDGAAGATTYAGEAARRGRRLAELEGKR